MREAGVLMPVSALPSRVGAGELGESAFHFIELLKKNHVRIWQILPLNPVGYGRRGTAQKITNAFSGKV